MKSNSIEIAATQGNLEAAKTFVEKRLKRSNISKEILSETLMVFDALFRSLLRQGVDQNTLLTIKTRRSFGEININLGFEGEQFVVLDDAGCLTEEDTILKEYEDKFDYSYQHGYNLVQIVV